MTSEELMELHDAAIQAFVSMSRISEEDRADQITQKKRERESATLSRLLSHKDFPKIVKGIAHYHYLIQNKEFVKKMRSTESYEQERDMTMFVITRTIEAITREISAKEE